MNKYKVIGADKKTGEDHCEFVVARSTQKAADEARTKGMYVSEVKKIEQNNNKTKLIRNRTKKKQPKYLFLHFLASLMIAVGFLMVLISLILMVIALVSDFKVNGSEVEYSFLSLIIIIPMALWGVIIGAMGGFLMAIKDIAINTWNSANRTTRVQVQN